MNEDKAKGLIIITTVMATIGLILILSSVKFGTTLAGSWLAKYGSIDTEYYYIMVESYINNFLVVGSILFSIGVISTVASYIVYSFSINKEN